MVTLTLCVKDCDQLGEDFSRQDLMNLLSACWRHASIHQQSSSLAHYVANRLGLATTSALPVAAFSALASDENRRDEDWYAYLDPVHLLPNRDTLMLLPASHLRISDSEAHSLCRDIAAFFQDQSWDVRYLSASHWLLRLPQSPDLQLIDLAEAQSANLLELMPRGSDATQWKKNLTELQMFLHHHTINQQRDQQGLPGINSVWLWGGGSLSQWRAGQQVSRADNAEHITLYADDAEIVGMARYLALTLKSSDGELSDLLAGLQGDNLMVMSLRQLDLGAQPGENPAGVCRRLLEPLRHAFDQARIDSLRVYFDLGVEFIPQRGLIHRLMNRFKRTR